METAGKAIMGLALDGRQPIISPSGENNENNNGGETSTTTTATPQKLTRAQQEEEFKNLAEKFFNLVDVG